MVFGSGHQLNRLDPERVQNQKTSAGILRVKRILCELLGISPGEGGISPANENPKSHLQIEQLSQNLLVRSFFFSLSYPLTVHFILTL